MNLILRKISASIINFLLFSVFFGVSKRLFLYLHQECAAIINHRVMTFNLYFLIIQLITFFTIVFYWKTQGSLGYFCVRLKVKANRYDAISLKTYFIRCIPFFAFGFGMTGVQFDVIPQIKSEKELAYALIGILALLFIIINSISIFFLKGISLIDILSRTMVVARGSRTGQEAAKG